jgi:hypothetical protein
MVAAEQHNDGRFSIDIRLFLVVVTLTMSVSFMAGIYGVTDNYYKNDVVGSRYEIMAMQYLFPSLFPSDTGVVTIDNEAALLNSSTSMPIVRDNFLTNDDIKFTEDEHRPSGQHLLVDMKGVDGDFLNSEERLSKALVDTVKEAGYVHFIVARCMSIAYIFLQPYPQCFVFFEFNHDKNDSLVVSLPCIDAEWCVVCGCIA